MNTSLWNPIELPTDWHGSSQVGAVASLPERLLPTDIIETAQNYIVEVALPGARPEDIEVCAVSHTLVLHATLREAPWLTMRSAIEDDASLDEPPPGDWPGVYMLQERPVGEIARTLHLPWDVDSKHIEATYEYGVLTLWVPKRAPMTPEHVVIYPKER